MSDDRKSRSEKMLFCSFCGKSQHEVSKLIAGPSVYICNECVDLCNDIIRQEPEAEVAGKKASDDLPIPHAIKLTLDDYVIGQEKPKKYSPLPFITIINVYVQGLKKPLTIKNPPKWSCQKVIFCSLAQRVQAKHYWPKP